MVKLARQLKQMGVPVLLTVQVDSLGKDDQVIPSNVARAANFYQQNALLIRGRPNIRAEDPQRTTILGNFKYDYEHKECGPVRDACASKDHRGRAHENRFRS